MEITRNAYISLTKWKDSRHRKPLILRGARQVGKTTLVRLFSKEFDNYIELSLERETDRKTFDKTDDISKLLDAIYLVKQVPVIDGTTLLFIDEIQESPKAIQLLRYFYEERPALFVIAAGSLLDFVIKKVPSFPVGRVEYLTLHPINFEEFLGAVNPGALEVLSEMPIPDYAHEILINLFHDYAIIGGMPEVVSRYASEKSFAGLSKIYFDLWQSYKDDIEKYAKNETERKIIRHIFETAPKEVDRIKFEGFGNSSYRSREVGGAFRALDLSRIIQLIYPSTNLQPPLWADLKKRPRLQFVDTGLITQNLLLQGDMIGIDDLNSFFRGKIIQHLICQELISIHDASAFKPHFWVREEKNSNSEVDVVYQYQKYLIPIEIKSGKQGTLKSLHQFVERTNHPYAIRLYRGNYGVEHSKTPGGKSYLLMNLPYYLGTQIRKYLRYFIDNYKL